MKLKSISIENFRSFKDKQTFYFSSLEEDSFNYISGENQVDIKLGANGAGKSTLGNALCWVLTGKTSEKFNAETLCNWDTKKGYCVELQFDDSILVRSWNPNSLKLNGENTTQEELEKKLDFTFDSFLYSTFISQFSSKFFDLDPADKLDVISSIIGIDIDVWVDIYSKKAKVKVDELTETIIKIDSKINKLEGKLSVLQNTNYLKESTEWKYDNQEQIGAICKEIEGYYAKLGSYEKQLKDLDKIHNKLIYALDKEIDSKIAQLESELNELSTKTSTLLQIIHTNDGDKKSSFKRLEKIEDLKDSCPTCEQKISSTHKEKIVDIETQHIAELEEENCACNELLEELELKKEELQKQRLVLVEQKIKIEDNEKLQNNLLNEIDKCNESIISLDIKLKNIAEKINPFIELNKTKQNKINLVIRLINYLKDTKKEYEEDLDKYKYWIDGYKKVRMFVIGNLLSDFEVSINNNLVKLGMPDWTVELKMDSETKKGTLKKGFTVFVKSPKNKKLVPFAVWSGGEGQRLRLAGTLGLIDFIRDKKPNMLDIEIYDEPTQFLTDGGIEDLLNLLRERAKNKNRKVFIIDHRTFNSFGLFNNNVKVIKTVKGSIFEVSKM